MNEYRINTSATTLNLAVPAIERIDPATVIDLEKERIYTDATPSQIAGIVGNRHSLRLQPKRDETPAACILF